MSTARSRRWTSTPMPRRPLPPTARPPSSVTRAYLDRIAADDDDAAAPTCTSTPRRRWRARPRSTPAARRRPALAGVPVALKDVVVTEGVPTTSGSKILEGWQPPYDATVAARLKAAGTVLLGKTNMDEFAMGSSTENSAYGVTRNPWDPERIPGGSSGGSSAAVAGGLAPWAIGTDTGGSIRQPAALTGLVGHKPTYGSVSRYGLIAFSSSLDQAGPMARTVLDAALLHEAIGGHDPLDSTSIDAPVPVLAERARRGADGDLTGLRVGVVRELGGEGHTDGYESGVLDRVRDAVALLESMGAEVREVSCPAFDLALAGLLPDRPERGVVQPGPLRRRPVRPARRRRRQPRPRRGHGADPRGGLRRRGQAPDHPRHLRPVQRLLRGLLRAGAEGPHADQPRLLGRLGDGEASTCWSAPRRRPSPSRSAPASTTRSPCTRPTCARCRRAWPACRRSRCPCGLSEGLPVGPADHGAGAGRRPLLPGGRGAGGRARTPPAATAVPRPARRPPRGARRERRTQGRLGADRVRHPRRHRRLDRHRPGRLRRLPRPGRADRRRRRGPTGRRHRNPKEGPTP